MITKIESINNIGNYEAYAASGDVKGWSVTNYH